MHSETGKWIAIVAFGVMIVGIVIYFFHDKLDWIGRLPGDIRIERENFSLYIPITTMILFSIVLTIVLKLITKFLR
jgi:hypothetical protein